MKKLVQIGGSSFPFSAFVIPAKAGIYSPACVWIPACAGMTAWKAASSPSGQGLLPQCTSNELIAGKPESARIYHGFQAAKMHSMP